MNEYCWKRNEQSRRSFRRFNVNIFLFKEKNYIIYVNKLLNYKLWSSSCYCLYLYTLLHLQYMLHKKYKKWINYAHLQSIQDYRDKSSPPSFFLQKPSKNALCFKGREYRPQYITLDEVLFLWSLSMKHLGLPTPKHVLVLL